MFPRWRLVAFLVVLLIAGLAVSTARAAKPVHCWLAFVVVQGGQIRKLEPVQRVDCPGARPRPKRSGPLVR